MRSDTVTELRKENARLAEENDRLRRDLQAAGSAFDVIIEAFTVASARIELLEPAQRSRLLN
ncbi:hypothetical protein V5F38_10365 [Xanthobacter sp. V0B-10]|uniref:hypothetical protein n=1 Tax=Xanthobacter albus TaxID=3119929 RepID=UPI00372A8252